MKQLAITVVQLEATYIVHRNASYEKLRGRQFLVFNYPDWMVRLASTFGENFDEHLPLTIEPPESFDDGDVNDRLLALVENSKESAMSIASLQAQVTELNKQLHTISSRAHESL